MCNELQGLIERMYDKYDDVPTQRIRECWTILSKPIPNEEGLEQPFYLWEVPYSEVEEGVPNA